MQYMCTIFGARRQLNLTLWTRFHCDDDYDDDDECDDDVPNHYTDVVATVFLTAIVKAL